LGREINVVIWHVVAKEENKGKSVKKKLARSSEGENTSSLL